jgi:hypothetical protein
MRTPTTGWPQREWPQNPNRPRQQHPKYPLPGSDQRECRETHQQARTPLNPTAAENHSRPATPQSPTRHRPADPQAYSSRPPSPLSHHEPAQHPAREPWSTLATSQPANPPYLSPSSQQILSCQQTPQGSRLPPSPRPAPRPMRPRGRRSAQIASSLSPGPHPESTDDRIRWSAPTPGPRVAFGRPSGRLRQELTMKRAWKKTR